MGVVLSCWRRVTVRAAVLGTISVAPSLAEPALALAAQPAAPKSAVAAEYSLGTRIDGYLTRLSGFGYSGTMMVVKDGRILLRRAYGSANDEAGFPVAIDTVFDIGSLSKSFTATAVMLLESRGALALSDPISRHLSDVPEDKRAITIEQLLAHRAGLERDFPFVNPTAEDYEEVSREEALRRIFATRLAGPPGGDYAYSNIGYVLLAAIVEQASGRPFRDFLRAELFEPAGMRSTGFWGSDVAALPDHRLARSYDERGETANLRDRSGTTWFDLGGGSMVSTINDLHSWFRALRANRILPAEALQRMWTPRPDTYGYGWFVDSTPDRPRRIYHGGDYLGFGSELAFYPELDLVTIHLANRQQEAFGTRHVADQGVRRIIRNLEPRMWANEAFDMPPAWTARLPETLRAVAGSYRLASGGELVIRPSGDALSIGGRGQDAVDLLFPAETEELARRQRYNERAIAMFDRGARGDRSAIESAIREGGDVEGWSGILRSLVHENDKGSLVSLTSLGTLPVASRGLHETILSLRFERGEELVQLGWDDRQERIVRSREGTPLLAPTLLRAGPDGGLVGWNLSSHRAIRVDPVRQGSQIVSISLVHRDGGRFVADRQPAGS